MTKCFILGGLPLRIAKGCNTHIATLLTQQSPLMVRLLLAAHLAYIFKIVLDNFGFKTVIAEFTKCIEPKPKKTYCSTKCTTYELSKNILPQPGEGRLVLQFLISPYYEPHLLSL